MTFSVVRAVFARLACLWAAWVWAVTPSGARAWVEPLPSQDADEFERLETARALRRLQSTVRVLYVTAHPDDEDPALLTWLARGTGARVFMFTITRGEEGENFLGPETGPALGQLRTAELLRADRWYGIDAADQFIGVAQDFGYSKRIDETWQHWDRNAVARELVRAIRTTQPHIIISRFQGNAEDGHGHHQAAGVLARQAFLEAADEHKFTDLGLRAWKAQKFYVQVRETSPSAKFATEVNTLVTDPVAHVSYYELGCRGYREHRSQSAAHMLRKRTMRPSWLKLVEPPRGGIASKAAARTALSNTSKETSVFEGLAVTLADLARTRALPDETQRAAERITALGQSAADAWFAAHVDDRPPASATKSALAPVLSGLRELRSLGDSMSSWTPDWERAAAQLAGVRVRVRSQPRQATVSATVTDRTTAQLLALRLRPAFAGETCRDPQLHTPAHTPARASASLTRTFTLRPHRRGADSSRSPAALPASAEDCDQAEAWAALADRAYEASVRVVSHGVEFEHLVWFYAPPLATKTTFGRAYLRPRIHARLPANTGVLYVRGTGDLIPETLGAMGARVRVTDADHYKPQLLRGMHVLMFGVHAASTSARSDLPSGIQKHRADILRFAERGGTILVQKQDERMDAWNLAPYPFEWGTRVEEVSEENAPVTILAPTHRALNWPYRITDQHFQGWVLARGSKFWSTWDDRYQPLLSCHDQDQPPQQGGLLVARVGEGWFVYSGYSLHRQIEAGVRGAEELLVNLVSLGVPMTRP
jgi:LmbE family N-acetylglucosaminyl deacetylase